MIRGAVDKTTTWTQGFAAALCEEKWLHGDDLAFVASLQAACGCHDIPRMSYSCNSPAVDRQAQWLPSRDTAMA